MDKRNSISFSKREKGTSRKKPMNIVAHLPADLSDLYRNLSEVQAKAIVKQINRLDCPYEQKVQILRSFSAAVQNNKAV